MSKYPVNAANFSVRLARLLEAAIDSDGRQEMGENSVVVRVEYLQGMVAAIDVQYFASHV